MPSHVLSLSPLFVPLSAAAGIRISSPHKRTTAAALAAPALVASLVSLFSTPLFASLPDSLALSLLLLRERERLAISLFLSLPLLKPPTRLVQRLQLLLQQVIQSPASLLRKRANCSFFLFFFSLSPLHLLLPSFIAD